MATNRLPGDDDFDFSYVPPEIDEGGFRVTARDGQLIVALIRELIDRQTEALPLYEELPAAAEFHGTRAFVRILRGSNRAGKTLTGAVEFARAVTGADPYGKYPQKNGIAFVFGLDGKHLGLTVFPKLFQPGAFRIIQDEATGQWRTYKPWADGSRIKDSLPAPPLIPPRFIEEIAWEEKKTKTPKMVRLVNGWVLYFFSSLAKMPQGQAIDLGWIDEEIENERLIAELTPRLADREGTMMWSCTPQVGSEQLLDLHEKAEAGGANVREFVLLLKDNPFISDEAKAKLLDTWTEEERRVRWDGEYAYSAVIIYPEFGEIHHFNPAVYELPGTPDDFQVPADWSIYVCVDPGRQVCATSFWAVPPPKIGTFWLMFAEVYLKQCDAKKFAAAVAPVVKDRVIEEFLIDGHAGRVNEMASGKNVEEQYRLALVEQKVETRIPGCYFVWGSDDVQAGREAVHDMLRIRPDGQPRFYIVRSRTPNFQWEIKRYRYAKRAGGLVTDVPEKKNDHLMDTARYLALRAPTWRAPRPPAKRVSGAVKSLQLKKTRAKQKNQGGAGGTIRLG